MSGTGRLPRLVRRWLSTGKARAVVRDGGRIEIKRVVTGPVHQPVLPRRIGTGADQRGGENNG